MKIFFLSLLLITSNYSLAAISTLEKNGEVSVMCSGGYIFVRDRGDGGVTQYMYWSKTDKKIKPAQCYQFGSGIRTIEQTGDLAAMCIGGYVFIRDRGDGGITQYMYWNNTDEATRPALCVEYAK